MNAPDPTAAVAAKNATTVYYNSACPVCDAGIRSQQERMSACAVNWVDVHQNPQAVEVLGVDLETVRERLHVRDAQGRVLVGADALAGLWRQTPGQAWLARLTLLTGWLSRPLYKLVARGLYRWNRRRGHW